MSDVLALVLPFFGLISLGFLVARITRQPVEALGWMNTFIIYVALPALFFNLLAKTPVEELTQWRFIVATTFATFCGFSLMFVIAAFITRGRIAESTVMALAAAYGNIGYMGPGLALLAFGEAAVVPVALIFCFDNTLHFTMAPLMMALSSDDPDPPPLWKVMIGVVRKIITHPFIISTIVGVGAAVYGFRPPEAAQTLLDYLANAAAPCALFAMGVTLALRPLKRVPVEAGFIAVIKLVIQPAIVYLLVTRIGNFPDVWVYVAVLLAALPTATNVFVIAQQYGVWIERASAMVLVTTVTSIFTVTFLLWLMTGERLPTDPF